jgi:hypothetical protein
VLPHGNQLLSAGIVLSSWPSGPVHRRRCTPMTTSALIRQKRSPLQDYRFLPTGVIFPSLLSALPRQRRCSSHDNRLLSARKDASLRGYRLLPAGVVLLRLSALVRRRRSSPHDYRHRSQLIPHTHSAIARSAALLLPKQSETSVDALPQPAHSLPSFLDNIASTTSSLPV